MRHERQVELLKRLKEHQAQRPAPLAPASRVNQADAYTDPARYEAEKQKLFRERPCFIGFSSDLAKSGDYLTADLGAVPIVVLRQKDGQLSGFVNACRHRAAPLVSGRGEKLRHFKCPYHAWTYSTEGKLIGRPNTGSAFDDVPMQNCALHGIAVAEHHGLVFARLQGDGPIDTATAMQGSETEIADYGLADYVHFETRMNEWDCNWKLILDTFTESYHIPFLHPETIAPYFTHGYMLCDLFGANPRTIGLKKTVFDEFEKPDEKDWALLPHATVQYFLTPNALVVHQLDHMEVWRVEPLGVGRTRVFTSLYTPPPSQGVKSDNYWRRNLDLLVDVTGTEDFPTMEAIHRNLASGMVPEVVYGQLEPGLINLHASIDRLLAEA